MTGLMGRWQKLQSYPDLICDTGHNADGFKSIRKQLKYIHEKLHQELHIVFGMVSDKDISSVLELLPKDATYYFTKASVKRAMPEDELMKMALEAGLKGTSYPTVVDAVRAAKENCPPKDFIFVGGSSFIVADLLANRDTLNLH
jgi:dihydrofolate synthase/folylpolyglutamate synthase